MSAEANDELARNPATTSSVSSVASSRPPRRALRGDRGDRPRSFDREDRQAPNTEVNGADRSSNDDERIAMDVFPPAIGRDEGLTTKAPTRHLPARVAARVAAASFGR